MKKYNIFTLSLIFILFLTYPCFMGENQVVNAKERDSIESNEINILNKNDINKKIDNILNDKNVIEDTKNEIKDEENEKKEKIEKEIDEKIKEKEEITKDDERIKKENIQGGKIKFLDKENYEKEIAKEKEEKAEEININSLSYNDIKNLGHTLRTGDIKERERALSILNKLGKKASPATNDIIASIHEKKTGKEAVDILYNIGSETAIAGLTRLISNDNKELGEYILKRIAGLKEKAQFVVDDLFANYSNKELKEEVIYALGEIKGDRSYYELREILKGSDSDKIKILALNQLLKFDDVRKDLPLFRRIFRKTPPSDFTLQLSNAIMKLEGSNF